MKREHKDSRGVVLRIGQLVAYNRSGSVIEGEIVGLGSDIRIEASRPWWTTQRWDRQQQKIVTLSPPERPNLSRVKHGHSVLVLKDVSKHRPIPAAPYSLRYTPPEWRRGDPCPRCKDDGTTVRNHDPIWHDGDVHCAGCGQYLRMYDAG